jgi:hypothetical protein
MVNARRGRLIPDTFYVNRDTLFLREKLVASSDSVATKGFKFEEFYLKFLLKDRGFQPIVRRIL